MHQIPISRQELAKANLAELQPQLATQQNNPPLPISLKGDFEWFQEKGPNIGDKDPRFNYQFEKELEQLKQAAQQKGLTLPQDFLILMSDERMLHKVYSRTDCYFEMPLTIDPVAPNSHNYLVRFYSDSQYTCFWYLCLDEYGNSMVLFSRDLYCYDEYEAYEHPEEDRTTQVFEYCTQSVEEFIFRYHIENHLAGKNTEAWNTLTPWEQFYVLGRDEK